MDALKTKFSLDYRTQRFKNYTVDGLVAGVYKSAGTLSYLRVYGAGHMVPAYSVSDSSYALEAQITVTCCYFGQFGSLKNGEAALQMFDQTQLGKGLQTT
jgi:carboxypeptidase C (cathepsin A)